MIPIQNTMSTPESVSYYATFQENQHIATYVFSNLSANDLGRCLSVCKQWNEFANNETLWNGLVPEMAFGPQKWTTYFGDIGEAPPVPRVMHQILNAPCPFWPGKKVHETHFLTLIPRTVRGNSLNLEYLGELVQNPLKGHPTICNLATGLYDDQPTLVSHWTLLSRDVVPDSRSKEYVDQILLLKEKDGGYEVPNILDATAALLIEHVQYETGPYSETCTRSQEKFGVSSQLTVGLFSNAGLSVYHITEGDFDYVGVSGQRKFLGHAS